MGQRLVFLLAAMLVVLGWNGCTPTRHVAVQVAALSEAPLPPPESATDELQGYLDAGRWHLRRALEAHRLEQIAQAQGDLDRAFGLLSAAEEGLIDSATAENRARWDRLYAAVEIAYLDLLPRIDNFSPDSPLTLLLQGLSAERIEELAPDATQLVHLHRLGGRCDLPIDAHPKVVASIHFFQTRGKETFDAWQRRSGRYRDMILEILRAEGLPEDLLYLAMIESGFRPTVQSRARAVGLWQFMAGTAKFEGLQRNYWLDERRDPIKATRAAARHLKGLYKQFGDWRLAAAAYNAGRGRVSRAIDRAGSRDFWQLDLPRETRNYVPLLMAMAVMSKDPELFGFEDIEMVKPMDFETVELSGFVSLKQTAQVLGLKLDQVRRLNPELLRLITPPAPANAGPYALRLPIGKAKVFQRWYAGQPQIDDPELFLYVVQPGDNLDKIAAYFGVGRRLIIEANGIRNPNLIKPRQKLYVPAGRAPVSVQGTYVVRRGDVLSTIARRHGTSVSSLRRWNGLGDDLIKVGQKLVVAPASASSLPAAGGKTYVVRQGDALSTIARRHGTSVSSLRRWNGLGDDLIKVGQKLVVALASTPSLSPVQGETYVVRRGDALSLIARRRGVSVSSLRRWNGLGDDLIKVGQKLVVAPAGRTAPVLEARHPAPSAVGQWHTVAEGETLSHIARLYGIKVGQLQQWNALSGSLIKVGQRLGVGTPVEAQFVSYTVDAGDTLYSIARKFGLEPDEVARQNNISTTAALSQGMKLKIQPTLEAD
jgi:membrane-bound lytic murein transglycosylase D